MSNTEGDTSKGLPAKHQLPRRPADPSRVAARCFPRDHTCYSLHGNSFVSSQTFFFTLFSRFFVFKSGRYSVNCWGRSREGGLIPKDCS